MGGGLATTPLYRSKKYLDKIPHMVYLEIKKKIEKGEIIPDEYPDELQEVLMHFIQ